MRRYQRRSDLHPRLIAHYALLERHHASSSEGGASAGNVQVIYWDCCGSREVHNAINRAAGRNEFTDGKHAVGVGMLRGRDAWRFDRRHRDVGLK